MKNELIVSNHAVGESNYHLQLTPAYRRDIFYDPLVQELTLAYIVIKLKELKVQLLAYILGLTICISSSQMFALLAKLSLFVRLKDTALI